MLTTVAGNISYEIYLNIKENKFNALCTVSTHTTI